MSTIREHLDAAVALEGEWPETVFGDVLDHVHAALKLLDEAPVHMYPIAHGEIEARRVVPDPAPSDP